MRVVKFEGRPVKRQQRLSTIAAAEHRSARYGLPAEELLGMVEVTFYVGPPVVVPANVWQQKMESQFYPAGVRRRDVVRN